MPGQVSQELARQRWKGLRRWHQPLAFFGLGWYHGYHLGTETTSTTNQCSKVVLKSSKRNLQTKTHPNDLGKGMHDRFKVGGAKSERAYAGQQHLCILILLCIYSFSYKGDFNLTSLSALPNDMTEFCQVSRRHKARHRRKNCDCELAKSLCFELWILGLEL